MMYGADGDVGLAIVCVCVCVCGFRAQRCVYGDTECVTWQLGEVRISHCGVRGG